MDNHQEDIGYDKNRQKTPKSYPTSRPSMPDSGQSRWREVLLKSPPLIKPRRMPNEILGDNYDEIKETLRAFGRSKTDQWDDYAKQIDTVLRQTMERCFAECRENGFYGPYLDANGEVKFAQVVEQTPTDREVYRVEERTADGVIEIKRCGKEWLRPNMNIIERIK